MEEMKKSASVSRTEQTYLLIPQYMNAAGRLYGGQLLYWIDMTAGIVGLRHADSNVVTACVDNITFKAGAFLTDVVTLIGEVTYTGSTSMEIRVDSYRENKGGERFLINRAYLVLVSLDDDGKPKKVPQLLIETEEQQAEWDAAIERKKKRSQ